MARNPSGVRASLFICLMLSCWFCFISCLVHNVLPCRSRLMFAATHIRVGSEVPICEVKGFRGKLRFVFQKIQSISLKLWVFLNVKKV